MKQKMTVWLKDTHTDLLKVQDFTGDIQSEWTEGVLIVRVRNAAGQAETNATFPAHNVLGTFAERAES